jgi:hypothetical protein
MLDKVPEYELIDSPFFRRRSCSHDGLRPTSELKHEKCIFKSIPTFRLDNPTKISRDHSRDIREEILQIGYHNPNIVNYLEFKGSRSLKNTVTQSDCNNDDIINIKNIVYNMYSQHYNNLKEQVKGRTVKQEDIFAFDDDPVLTPLPRQRSDCKIISQANKSITFSKESKFEQYIEDMNKNINIKQIDRSFSIRLKEIILNEKYIESINRSKEPFIDFEIMMKLYCGNKAISKSIDIRVRKGRHNLNFLLMRRIYFDILYSGLPLYSSIIFKIKTPVIEEKKVTKKTIAWANFRLFDYLRHLKTGLHKISFWNTLFSDDSYFQWTDNYQDNTGFMAFELDSFVRPVEFITTTPTTIPDESIGNVKQIEWILNKNHFEELNQVEKKLLWNNRYAIIDKQIYLPRLFFCVDYSDTIQLDELQQFIKVYLYLFRNVNQ